MGFSGMTDCPFWTALFQAMPKMSGESSNLRFWVYAVRRVNGALRYFAVMPVRSRGKSKSVYPRSLTYKFCISFQTELSVMFVPIHSLCFSDLHFRDGRRARSCKTYSCFRDQGCVEPEIASQKVTGVPEDYLLRRELDVDNISQWEPGRDVHNV